MFRPAELPGDLADSAAVRFENFRPVMRNSGRPEERAAWLSGLQQLSDAVAANRSGSWQRSMPMVTARCCTVPAQRCPG